VIEHATVDVSVALKWALDDEEGLAEALTLRDEMVVHRRAGCACSHHASSRTRRRMAW